MRKVTNCHIERSRNVFETRLLKSSTALSLTAEHLLKFAMYLTIFFITSCEEVIDVDLNEAEPRLVIEASIDWLKGTSGNDQVIKLSLSSPYFNNQIPPATGASVSIIDENNNTFNFIEDGNSGDYVNSNFIPELNGVYNLTVSYNGETYTGIETLKSVASIDFVEQER